MGFVATKIAAIGVFANRLTCVGTHSTGNQDVEHFGLENVNILFDRFAIGFAKARVLTTPGPEPHLMNPFSQF
jgi:hypothetical protein